jgi:hypothetical protein
VATVVFEQQNIYNNTNINVDNTSNNNVGKWTLKHSEEYFKYGWRGTTYHLTAYCPRLIIAPISPSFSYCHQLNCAKLYVQIITYLLTYSMEQSPSWEANWSATSQEIPRILWNPKVHHRTLKRTPPVPILS